MKREDYNDLSKMCHGMAEISSAFTAEGKAEPANLATSAAVLTTALMGVIDTLEEIRDELRAGNGREG